MVILAGHHAGHGYTLLLVSTAAGYAQIYATTFTFILNSLQFTT